MSDKSSQAEALNNQGQVVGWQRTGSFLWENGKQQVISQERYQGAQAINEAGQVVGIPSEIHTFQSGSILVGIHTFQTGSILSGASAFVWDRGHLDYLPDFSEAYSINSQGEIAGVSSNRATLWQKRHVTGRLADDPGFIWQSLPAHKLAQLSGYPYSIAYSLNAQSEAVGVMLSDLNNIPEHGRAFRYKEGKAVLLPLPASGSSAAFCVNAKGGVAGAFRRTGGQWQAVIWRKGEAMKVLTLLPGYASGVAHSINVADQVVGWAFPQTNVRGVSLGLDFGPGPDTRACLWQDTTAFDLNTLIPQGTGWILQEARAINDKGWIVGGGTLHGKYHAFLLVPTSKM